MSIPLLLVSNMKVISTIEIGQNLVMLKQKVYLIREYYHDMFSEINDKIFI